MPDTTVTEKVEPVADKTNPNPDVSVETLEHEEKARLENLADKGESPEPEKTEPDSEKTEGTEEKVEDKVEEKTEPVKKDPDDTHDVRRMKKFMQRAFEAEAKLQALEKAQVSAAPIPQEQKVPERKDFDSDAEYYNAVNNYNIGIVRREFEQKLNESKAQETRKVLDAKVAEARKEHPDYDEVVSESTVGFLPVIQQSIVESDVSAELIYRLAKDEDLAEKISKLPPHLAIKELGKLEVRIESEKSGKKTQAAAKPVSKAPAPIKPVASKADVGAVDPAKMSDAEWMAWRRRNKYKLSK